MDKGELKNMCGLIYFTDGKGISRQSVHRTSAHLCRLVHMRVMRCRHGRCRWSWRKQYEYKTGKKRSEKYSESIPVKGCTWRVRDTADQAKTDALIGPPGVGKTQIMEQIAREMQIGLVAYTITHHTRQSAVGLPFIKEREYDGKSYSVTEYTMSEIIASVYERMEATGLRRAYFLLMR